MTPSSHSYPAAVASRVANQLRGHLLEAMSAPYHENLSIKTSQVRPTKRTPEETNDVHAVDRKPYFADTMHDAGAMHWFIAKEHGESGRGRCTE